MYRQRVSVLIRKQTALTHVLIFQVILTIAESAEQYVPGVNPALKANVNVLWEWLNAAESVWNSIQMSIAQIAKMPVPVA